MIEKQEKFIQNFPEICMYSCSKNNEVRNFNLFREEYFLTIKNFRIKLLEFVRIECQYCKWRRRLPGSFARKVFKKGLRASTLIAYSADKILSNYVLNLYASLWIVFSLVFLFSVILVIYKFYTEPVLLSDPEEITVNDLKNSKYIGKIVKLKGLVNYPLAFTLDQLQENRNGSVNLVSREVYLPIFNDKDPTHYVLLRGGKLDVDKVLAKQGINDITSLENQEYEVIGKVENIDLLTHPDLRKFYLEELPSARSLTPASILVVSVGIKDLNTFLLENSNYVGIVFCIFLTSMALQIYIDRKIVYKH
ncbi:MAG: hypothetical protein KatS3mg083_067 [Candidatus Dojkabacteria bacterium]|nr:MAG: hypothetical protein KatS3mg083_067 [Candidatus Dojkabacteria bacterium]